MKNTNLTSGLTGINLFVIALFLLLSPLTGLYAACCSGHGGVASCNKSTGHQMCKDGTASPTCICKVPKTTTTKKEKTTTTTTPSSTPPATTKPKHSWWGGKSTTSTNAPASTTTSTSTNGKGAQGCCSHHGGVAQCNKSTGHQMCKDGSQSSGCTCH